MAKGYYYPELLAIHNYSENPREAFNYLQSYSDSLRDALLALESGESARPVRLDGHSDDLDRAISFGSLVHEYVHHLQYTSRHLGHLFHECRHQQSVWTHHCLRELRESNCPPLLPLLQHACVLDTQNAILHRWREGWLPYQAAIATTGLGASLSVEAPFKYQASHDFFVATGTIPAEDQSCELSWEPLLEAEAQIITAEVLSETFPNVSHEARHALGEDEGAANLRERGLHPIVPLLCDYCMQARFVLDNKTVSPRLMFDAALDAVEKRYAGIEHRSVLAHHREILATAKAATGLPTVEEMVVSAIDAFEKGGVSNTPLGELLRRGMAFRKTHPTMFSTVHAFIIVIMRFFPVPVWHYFNSQFYAECPNESCSFGELDAATLPFVYQRLCVWGAREFALRSGTILCPDCRLNVGRRHCSGTCCFAHTCRDQFGYDPATGNWATDSQGELTCR